MMERRSLGKQLKMAGPVGMQDVGPANVGQGIGLLIFIISGVECMRKLPCNTCSGHMLDQTRRIVQNKLSFIFSGSSQSICAVGILMLLYSKVPLIAM